MSSNIHRLATSNSQVCAALRRNRDELALIRVNLTDEAISDYVLTLKYAGLAEKTHRAEMLLGGRQENGPQGGDGGFSRYKPLDRLNPYGSYIIRLIP